jgi:hypothetical protein
MNLSHFIPLINTALGIGGSVTADGDAGGPSRGQARPGTECHDELVAGFKFRVGHGFQVGFWRLAREPE